MASASSRSYESAERGQRPLLLDDEPRQLRVAGFFVRFKVFAQCDDFGRRG